MSVVGDHQIFLVPEQFSTIQRAVDAVVGPSTIVVSAGVYAENVEVSGKESLVIQSAQLSRRGVTFTGGRAAAAVLSVRGSALHLSGIEVRSNGGMRGVMVVDGAISLQECVVAGNRIDPGAAEAFGAGLFCRNSTVRIQKSAVVGNTVDARSGQAAGGGGLYLQDCKIEIAGATIQANAVYAAEGWGGGLWCERSSMRMWRSRVTDNAVYAALANGGGIYFKDPRGCQLGGSVITGNGCPNGTGGGIVIDGDSTLVTVHRNTVVRQNHPADMTCRHTRV